MVTSFQENIAIQSIHVVNVCLSTTPIFFFPDDLIKLMLKMYSWPYYYNICFYTDDFGKLFLISKLNALMIVQYIGQ